MGAQVHDTPSLDPYRQTFPVSISKQSCCSSQAHGLIRAMSTQNALMPSSKTTSLALTYQSTSKEKSLPIQVHRQSPPSGPRASQKSTSQSFQRFKKNHSSYSLWSHGIKFKRNTPRFGKLNKHF